MNEKRDEIPPEEKRAPNVPQPPPKPFNDIPLNKKLERDRTTIVSPMNLLFWRRGKNKREQS